MIRHLCGSIVALSLAAVAGYWAAGELGIREELGALGQWAWASARRLVEWLRMQ